jgi:hypothetical protein
MLYSKCRMCVVKLLFSSLNIVVVTGFLGFVHCSPDNTVEEPAHIFLLCSLQYKYHN